MAISEQHLREIKECLTKSESELREELERYFDGTRGLHPLGSILHWLEHLICVEWDWPTKRDKGNLNDPINLAMAIADCILCANAKLPVPASTLAAYVVRMGLDIFCKDCPRKAQ